MPEHIGFIQRVIVEDDHVRWQAMFGEVTRHDSEGGEADTATIELLWRSVSVWDSASYAAIDLERFIGARKAAGLPI